MMKQISLLMMAQSISSTFKGNKIFGYKVGTGTTEDTELDMVLSFKDIGPKADYVFENCISRKHTIIVYLLLIVD